MFKDFLNRPLTQGDRVIHGVGGRYAGLSGPYIIHSFTPKMVRLCYPSNLDMVQTVVPSGNLVLVPHV